MSAAEEMPRRGSRLHRFYSALREARGEFDWEELRGFVREHTYTVEEFKIRAMVEIAERRGWIVFDPSRRKWVCGGRET